MRLNWQSWKWFQNTNSPFCKVQHYFIDSKARRVKPEPFYSPVSASPSVKVVQRPPLTMSRQLGWSGPLLLHSATSDMLCYLIPSAGKVFVLVAPEKAPRAKLSYLFRDGFIFHGWPQRCLMELLTAHHTSRPWKSVSAESRDKATAMWLRWKRQLAAGSITPSQVWTAKR